MKQHIIPKLNIANVSELDDMVIRVNMMLLERMATKGFHDIEIMMDPDLASTLEQMLTNAGHRVEARTLIHRTLLIIEP